MGNGESVVWIWSGEHGRGVGQILLDGFNAILQADFMQAGFRERCRWSRWRMVGGNTLQPAAAPSRCPRESRDCFRRRKGLAAEAAHATFLNYATRDTSPTSSTPSFIILNTSLPSLFSLDSL